MQPDGNQPQPPLIQRGLDRLKTMPFLRNVLMLSGSTIIAQGLFILVAPILSRIYLPEEFGILQVYISLLGIFIVISSLRYEIAITLPKREESGANLVAVSLILLLVTSALLTLLMVLFTEPLLKLLNAEALGPYIWLLPLGFLGNGFYNIFNFWAVRKQEFGWVAKTKLTQSVSQTTTQLALGLIGLGPLGLLLGEVIGKTAGVGLLIKNALRMDRSLLSQVSWPDMKRLAIRYRRFPLISAWGSLMNSLGLNLPALLLGILYSPQIVGVFALGERVVGIPLTFLGRSVGQVFLGKAAEVAHTGLDKLRELYIKTAKRLFLVGLFPFFVLLIPGPWLFVLVFGEPWRLGGIFIQILAIRSLLKLTVNPLSQALNVLERQDLQFFWDLARLILVVASFGLAFWFDWSPTGAVIAYSAAASLAYFGLFFLTLYALDHPGIKEDEEA